LNFTLMTPVATPMAARTPSTNTSLKRDLSMESETSARRLWTTRRAAVQLSRDHHPERTAAVTGRADARPGPRGCGGIFVFLWL
jgi:hypothetical protein